VEVLQVHPTPSQNLRSAAHIGEKCLWKSLSALDESKYRYRTSEASEATRSEASAPAAKRRYLMALSMIKIWKVNSNPKSEES
jgi:hypothetical protein